MKKIIILFLLLPSLLFSQMSTQQFKAQRKNLMIYNVSLGALIGGFSELIANPRKDKAIKAFLHGFCVGALGGGINSIGKVTIGEVLSRGYYGLALPSRLINSFGNSIIYNTAHSKNLYFQYFNFDYGFIQFQVDCINNSFIPKISPFSIVGTIISIKGDSKFNLNKSLLLGVPFFYNDSLVYTKRGYTYMSSININTKTHPLYPINNTVAHEFIHVLQFYEYSNISNLLFGAIKSYKDNKKIWKFVNMDISYIDIPYSLIESFSNRQGYNNYYNNFYEREARNFAKQLK